jgi:alpha-tubulin suppressor-like RCC1 family protein
MARAAHAGSARGRRVVVLFALVALATFTVSAVAGARPRGGSADRAAARAAGAGVPARALAAGADQTCALLATGAVECWGDNADGQLGDGTSRGPQSCNGDPCSSTPVAVHAIVGATAIAAGGSNSCALLSDASIDCWGENLDGQLGAGSSRGPQSCGGYPCSSTPLAVRGISNATAIAAGADQICALLSTGAVECWGDNADGQLGDGSSVGPQSCNGDPCSSAPVVVHGIANATAIAAGGADSCALLAGGRVDCWGENDFGQLGDGSSRGPQTCNGDPCATTPVAVEGVSGATAIAAGNNHVCALLAGGGVDCWGYNFAAELGIGTSSGVEWCTGGEWCSTKPLAVLGMAGATSIVAGGDHTCVLVSGAVKCWGYNSYGQLGDGTSAGPQVCYWQLVQCAKTPIAVHAIANATGVAAGGEHSCALAGAGSVSCWGANWFGDLGDGARSGPQRCNGYPCATAPVTVRLAPPP